MTKPERVRSGFDEKIFDRSIVRNKAILFLNLCFSDRPDSVAAPEDWEAVISSAAREGMLPALHQHLQELRTSGRRSFEPPTEVREFLETVAHLNGERNQQILNQARDVVGILNHAGITPLALKGLAYLLTGIYPDPATRYVGDIDLLISEAQILPAVNALKKAGYTPNATDPMARFRHHAPEMLRSGTVPVELHHSLTLDRAGRRLLTTSEMLNESLVRSWRGADLRLPSPEHLVSHLILHSQIQHPYKERIWPPLRAMYDLMCLNRNAAFNVNWRSIEKRFRQHGQSTTLSLHLLRVQEILGLKPPIPIALGPLEKLRWWRRKVLNRWPGWRFVDPVYLFQSTLSRRLRLLSSVFSFPGGWRVAFGMLFRIGFYRRLVSEVTLK